jgi:hypothetical protein
MKTKEPAAACNCPGNALRQFEKATSGQSVRHGSELTHWPVQLALVPPGAPFLKNSDVVLVADCVPVAYPNLHQDFLKDRSVLVACPKLDNFEAHLAKLTGILEQAHIKSLTVVHMEVPCCSGLTYMAKKAMADSGVDVPFKEVTIGVRGNIKEQATAGIT